MKTHINILTFDKIVQSILLILTFGTGFISLFENDFVMFLGIAMLFLGAWQILSGIFVGIVRKDPTRRQYIFGAILYVIFLGVLMSIGKQIDLPDFFGVIMSIFLFIVGPLIIAVWYFLHTLSELSALKEKMKGLTKVHPNMENVLDSEEIFKPINTHDFKK